MDIYIKPKKKVYMKSNNIVRISDVAEIIASKDIIKKLNKIEILNYKDKDKNYFLISVIDIIRIIKDNYPNCTVNNVGEIDTVIEFEKESILKSSKFIEFLKIFFVTIVLAIGSSTAIMGFHNDSQIYKIFRNYKKIFLNNENASIFFIEVPYSIGLAVGIIVFYNHFMGRKITNDPTPIEVEMSIYEKDVIDTVIDNLDTENKNKE